VYYILSEIYMSNIKKDLDNTTKIGMDIAIGWGEQSKPRHFKFIVVVHFIHPKLQAEAQAVSVKWRSTELSVWHSSVWRYCRLCQTESLALLCFP